MASSPPGAFFMGVIGSLIEVTETPACGGRGHDYAIAIYVKISTVEMIFLIETFPGGLKEIRSYFAEMGTPCRGYSSVGDVLKSKEEPTLILLLADRKTYKSDLVSLKIHPDFAKVPRVSIFPPDAVEVPESGGPDGETVFQMPVDRATFLARVADMQKRPLRRVFEIVVNLRPEGTNIKYSGKSLDFSRSGMALECSADFSTGHRLTVSFVDPRSRKRFVLDAEVVRKQIKLISGSAIYGIRFLNIGEQDVNDLMNFIAGKSAA